MNNIKTYASTEYVIKEIEKVKGNISSGVKTVNGVKPDESGNIEVKSVASWNDLPDKPFGEVVGEEEIAPEAVHTFSYNDDEMSSFSTLSYCSIEDFEEGKLYYAVIDGITYEFVGSPNSETFVYGTPFGEPILLIRESSSFASGYGIRMMLEKEYTGEHTLRIYTGETVIHTLDEKFIPETIARTLDLVQSDWDETDETSLAFIKNKPNENDAMQIAIETELIEPVATADGEILVDSTGTIITF